MTAFKTHRVDVCMRPEEWEAFRRYTADFAGAAPINIHDMTAILIRRALREEGLIPEWEPASERCA